jgi:hypothetical protein
MVPGGEIYHMQRTEEEDKGMVPGGVDLSNTNERGMVPEGS